MCSLCRLTLTAILLPPLLRRAAIVGGVGVGDEGVNAGDEGGEFGRGMHDAVGPDVCGVAVEKAD